MSILHEDFTDRLKLLHRKCDEIQSYYHEYDYADVKCNGFRSFVTSFDLYYAFLLKTLRKKNGFKKHSSTLKEFDTMSQLLIIDADIAAMIHEKGVDYPQACTEKDVKIMEKLLEIEPKHVKPMVSKVGPFNIDKKMRKQLKETVMGLHLMMNPTLAGKAGMVLSPKRLAKKQADGIISMDMEMIAAARSMHKFPIKNVIKVVMRPRGCTSKKIAVPRDTNDWMIHVKDARSPAVLLRKSSFIRSTSDEYIMTRSSRPQAIENGPPVECILIKPKSGIKQRTLMMHMPSGGFFMQLADVYVPLMSKVSRDLGIAIVIVKYATTPEAHYPAALQDVLDLYMFFSSGSEKVNSMIGFLPENIVLSGDSAGGNMAITTTIALNEIKMQGGEVTFPKSIALQSPAMTVGFVVNPGMALSGIDLMVTMGQLRFAVTAYCESPHDPLPDFDHHLKNHNDFDSWKKIITRYNERMKDPLHNPLVYEHFEDFKDISMSILATEMDTIVDHAVYIAKKWIGPVTMDVARLMPHTFLAMELTPALTPYIDLLVRRLATALEINVV